MEKKVIFKEDENGIARCPTCGATFYKDGPNWGKERCGHCGQRLIWTNPEKEDK